MCESLSYLFTLRFQLFFIYRCHLFSFINSCAFSYRLSFLLLYEACGGNVVESSVCCPSFCCSYVCYSLNYYTSIRYILHKCRIFFSVAPFGAAIVVFFCARRCCLLLLQLCLLLKHLRSSAFSPCFTSFLSLSYF